MAIRLSATLVAVLLAFGVASCASPDVDRADAAEEYEFTGVTSPGRLLPQGQRTDARAFSGELLDGTAVDSAELSGDVAVVNVWRSWCAPCRVETPDVQAVYTEFREQGVQFLGVDVKDERQLATAFLSNVGAESIEASRCGRSVRSGGRSRRTPGSAHASPRARRTRRHMSCTRRHTLP